MEISPSFDTWTSSFLIAVTLGIFLFGLLLTTRNRKILPIALFVLVFSLILLQYVLYWTQYQFVYPYLVHFPSVCYYSTGPLLYWYFYNLYKKEKPQYFAVHFIPAALGFIPYFFNLLKNTGFQIEFIPLHRISQYYQLIIVHMVVYALLLFVMIKKHSKSKLEYNTIRTRWARLLASLYAIFIFAYFSYYLLINFPFFNNEWDYAISGVMSISIYAIGYFIFKQPKVFDGEFYAHVFLPNSHNKDATLEDRLLAEMYSRIIKYMEKEKPYKDNELRLANLADQLGFSTHLLSKVINNKYGDNFNNFVNAYRLDEAEALLKSEEDTSIKTVYFDVGFNSKAAFYSAFKQKHNCTPSQFRQQFRLS